MPCFLFVVDRCMPPLYSLRFDVINHFSFNKSDEDLLSSTDCGDVAEEGSDGSNEFPSGTADEISPRLGHSRTEEIPRPFGVLKSKVNRVMRFTLWHPSTRWKEGCVGRGKKAGQT